MPPPPAAGKAKAPSPGKRGLNKPAGLGGLSVEVTVDTQAESSQLSLSSLTQAPLSAILGAFGFGASTGPPSFSTGGGPFTSGLPSVGGLNPPPSANPFSALPSPALLDSLLPQPLSAKIGAVASTPLFGLTPTSVHGFMGNRFPVLEKALDQPLSTQPLTHSRKSPRLSSGFPTVFPSN